MVENWSINREDYEERSETARVVSQTAADVWPSESSWGLFSYGDAPGGIGGGCGCFCWFDNKSKLLQFVETHLVFLNPGPVSMDPAEVAEAVRAAIERIRAGTLDMESGRVEANIQLRSFSQIEWWESSPSYSTRTRSLPFSCDSGSAGVKARMQQHPFPRKTKTNSLKKSGHMASSSSPTGQ